MGKTYSMDQKWKKLTSHGYDESIVYVWDKLNRHPNKKKHKGSQHREYRETSSCTYAWRNPCGEEHDKSSRIRLVRKNGVGILRQKQKSEARRIINESLNEE